MVIISQMFQTGIVGLLLIAVLTIGGFYFVHNNGAVQILPSSNDNKANYSSTTSFHEKTESLSLDAPAQWIKREIKNQTQFSDSAGGAISENNNQGNNQKRKENKNVFQPTSSNQTFFSSSDSTSGVSSQDDRTSITGEYYKKFLESTFFIGFDANQLAGMKKEENGRALTLEELIDLARNGTPLGGLKSSFLAWSDLDKRVLAQMEGLSVDSRAAEIHQELLEWFKYHQATAEKLSGDIDLPQINKIYFDFQEKAAVHNSQFKKYLDNPIISDSLMEKIFGLFLPPRAEAFTCGAMVPPPFYHFGGRVILMKPCNWGIVETISPPCGGELLFTYPVLAGNPFLWKKPTIGSAVLGRSVIAPGICPVGIIPMFPYEAIVLYFGTSLTP